MSTPLPKKLTETSVSLESTSFSINSSETVCITPHKTRNRIAFFFIGLCSLSLQSFLNVIANKALGAGKHTAVIMLALYVPQVLMRVFTDYWSKLVSYHIRFMVTAMLSVVSLTLLYTYMDESSNITDPSLLHFPRLCVLLSTTLIGISTTIGEVSAFGYCTFYEKQCTNTMSSGGGFGAFLGAALSLIQNELKFSNKSVIIACFIFPIGLAFSYSLGVTHSFSKLMTIPQKSTDTDRSRIESESSTEMRIVVTTNNSKTFAKSDGESSMEDSNSELDDTLLRDIQTKRIGASMTIKLLIIDLVKYTFPLFAVYFLYNIILAGFIAPSFDVLDTNQTPPVIIHRYKKVYQYFVFSLRIGVFSGKSSGCLHIRKLLIFPMLFSGGIVFGCLLAYAPELMKWFILETAGHWVIWLVALPLGWTYGATSANVLFGLRNDCADRLKEFALSNVTFASAFGQCIGNVVAIFIAQTVFRRHNNM